MKRLFLTLFAILLLCSPLDASWTFNPHTGKLDYHVGPTSSTDHAVVRWDGTTGRVAQDSTMILDDTGNISGIGNITIPTTKWLGLGAAKGRIEFVDAAIDKIKFSDCYVGMGIAVPGYRLDVHGDIRADGNVRAGNTGYFIFHPDTSVAMGRPANDTLAFYTAGEKLRVDPSGNIGIGATTFGTDAVRTLAIALGTDPTADVANQFAFWGKDFAEGNTCPYFRTENGTVIGLNQSLLTTDDVSFAELSITGLSLNIVAKTAAYTATAIDDVITCGAGNETFTVDLPVPVNKKVYYIKNVGTGLITVDAQTTGSTTIDGQNTQQIVQYDTLCIIADASVYHII